MDFASLERLESESRFALSLGALPLSLAGWVLDEDDAELRPLLDELRGVRVYAFEGVRNDADVAQGIDDLKAKLLRDGWQSVAAIRDGADRVSVMLRPGAEGTIHGFTVIVQEPSEVVFVNLIGNVRLDLIGGYMSELDLGLPAFAVDTMNGARGFNDRGRRASETGP